MNETKQELEQNWAIELFEYRKVGIIVKDNDMNNNKRMQQTPYPFELDSCFWFELNWLNVVEAKHYKLLVVYIDING